MTDLLTVLEIIGLIGGVSIGGYIVNVQVMKAALNKEMKGMAVEQIFKQIGLSKANVKDFNSLTPQGVANLVSVIREVKGSTGSSFGLGPQFEKQLQEINALQQFSAMAGQMAQAGGQYLTPGQIMRMKQQQEEAARQRVNAQGATPPK